MGRMTKGCSICGAEVLPWSEEAKRHIEMRCGTWEQLLNELERLHRVSADPFLIDEAVRVVLRKEAEWTGR